MVDELSMVLNRCESNPAFCTMVIQLLAVINESEGFEMDNLLEYAGDHDYEPSLPEENFYEEEVYADPVVQK